MICKSFFVLDFKLGSKIDKNFPELHMRKKYEWNCSNKKQKSSLNYKWILQYILKKENKSTKNILVISVNIFRLSSLSIQTKLWTQTWFVKLVFFIDDPSLFQIAFWVFINSLVITRIRWMHCSFINLIVIVTSNANQFQDNISVIAVMPFVLIFATLDQFWFWVTVFFI